jgi:hypothetical protein
LKVRRVVVSNYTALMLAHQGRDLPAEMLSQLPAGARIIGSLPSTDPDSAMTGGATEFYITHDSFDEVPIDIHPPMHGGFKFQEKQG